MKVTSHLEDDMFSAAPEGSLGHSRRGTELSFGKDARSLLLLAVAGNA